MAKASYKPYATAFLLILGMLMLCAAGLTFTAPDYGRAGFNFFSMKEGEVLDLTGLDRKQTGSLKFGFLQQHSPPRVGIFGNHVVQYFTLEDFDGLLQQGEFFNFWYANLGLPELFHVLSFLEQRNKLPTQLVLVQITTPNNDMGRHIIDWGGELPDAFIDPGHLWNEGAYTFLEWFIAHYMHSKLKTTFDVNKLRALAGQLLLPPVGEQIKKRIIATDAYLSTKEADPSLLSRSYRPDGSFDHQYAFKAKVTLNGNSTRKAQKIFWGDEAVIAKYMRAIHDLVEKDGRKLVFLVPPVYESDRDTEVDRIFDKALEQVRDITVLDYRGHPKKKKYFYLYDHPSNLFYKELVRDMCHQGLLSQQTHD